MKFNRSLDWLKESDEDDNLLADDELDAVEEEMNEGLYVDPSNYDKHNDLVDVVDKAGNPQKMTQATYDKNKDSGEFEKKEPEEKEQDVNKETKAAMSDFEKSPEFTELKDAISNVSEPDSSSDAAWNRDRAYIYSQAFPVFAKMEKQGRDPLEEFKQYKDNLPIKQEDIDKIKKELRELDSDLTSKRYLYGYNSDEVKELDNKRKQIVNKLNDAEATYKNQIPKNFETALFYYGKLKSGDDKFKRSFIPWMKKHTQAYYNKYKDGATPPSIPAVAGLPEIEFEQSSKDKERQNVSNANSLDKIKDLANKGDLEAIKALLNS